MVILSQAEYVSMDSKYHAQLQNLANATIKDNTGSLDL